jgi:hypothetical protein
MEQWRTVPPFLRGLIYGLMTVAALAVVVLIVAGVLWLVGNPFHQCSIR